MPTKSANSGAMWGQDVPYFANNPKVQQYEQEQKQKKKIRLHMKGSKVQAESFTHQRAIEHSKSFVNFKLAGQMHGIPTAKKLRLF